MSRSASFQGRQQGNMSELKCAVFFFFKGHFKSLYESLSDCETCFLLVVLLADPVVPTEGTSEHRGLVEDPQFSQVGGVLTRSRLSFNQEPFLTNDLCSFGTFYMFRFLLVQILESYHFLPRKMSVICDLSSTVCVLRCFTIIHIVDIILWLQLTVHGLIQKYETCGDRLRSTQIQRRISSLRNSLPVNFSSEVMQFLLVLSLPQFMALLTLHFTYFLIFEQFS